MLQTKPLPVAVNLTRKEDIQRFNAIKSQLCEKTRVHLNNPRVLEFLMKFYQDHCEEQ